MDLEENRLRQQLEGRMIGDPVWILPEVSSTNNWLREFVSKNNTPGGAMVVTDYQTSGKGRMRREWSCPPKMGLLFSVFWIPRLSIEQWPLYSMAAALAVHDLLTGDISGSHKYGDILFKWPNDIFAGGKKICGILCETATAQGIVVGVGLNVLQEKSQLPDDNATSVFLWSGQQLDRSVLLTKLIPRLEHRFTQTDQGNGADVLDDISRIGLQKNTEIRIQIGDNFLLGTYQGLSPNGMLILQTTDGLVHNLATVDKLIIIDE